MNSSAPRTHGRELLRALSRPRSQIPSRQGVGILSHRQFHHLLSPFSRLVLRASALSSMTSFAKWRSELPSNLASTCATRRREQNQHLGARTSLLLLLQAWFRSNSSLGCSLFYTHYLPLPQMIPCQLVRGKSRPHGPSVSCSSQCRAPLGWLRHLVPRQPEAGPLKQKASPKGKVKVKVAHDSPHVMSLRGESSNLDDIKLLLHIGWHIPASS